MAELAAINVSMRKLKQLNVVCGGSVGQATNVPEVDFSKMTPYQGSQYRIAERMKVMRTLITELDALPIGGNPTKKVEISNQIRKEDRKLKSEMQEARIQAQSEQKQSDYEELQKHCKVTQQLWKNRSGGPSNNDDDVTGGYGATSAKRQNQREASVELENALPAPGGYSLRDDEEFTMFFQQTHQNDQLIDKALDRLQQGVQRLAENATVINQELKVQSVLIDETEKKVDGVSLKLKTLNGKLKETIKAVDSDRMCMYLFCVIVLLGIAGGIYYLISGKS